MRRLLIVLFFAVAATLCLSPQVEALSLKIAPLHYDAELQKGEVKKGFIDISNPYTTTTKVRLEVQAFRQIDNQGSLEFFDSDQMKRGVKLDYDVITLGPLEAYRVYFLLDGTKLAEGNSFGAIFASTVPGEGAGAHQAVRVGTLLSVVNGMPSGHDAEVTVLDAHWLQVGDRLTARAEVRNTADAKTATGFYPSIEAGVSPYGARTIKGPLVFAGRTRTVDIVHQGSYFGPVWLSAKVGESSKSKMVFAVTGYWRWLAPVLLVVCISIMTIAIKRSRRSSGVRTQ